MQPLVAFAACLLFFHTSEFGLAFLFTRSELTWHSWLVSTPYCLAMATALLEYGIEHSLAPSYKKQQGVSYAGLALLVAGEGLRKAAILQAGRNFTHRLALKRREGHELVTSGVYTLVRHPGYLGWMLWAVGTQVLLVNPVCACAFTYVSWQFFRQRIVHEEAALQQFFGSSWAAYASRTPSGIPWT